MIFHTAYVQSKTFEKPGPQPRNWWSDMPEGNCTINNGCCPNYTDNMKWQARKPGSLEGGIPSLPDGTLIPIIHFHSYCKIMVVHETFLRFWPVQPDLTVLPLPFLQLSSSAANNDGWNGSYWVFIQAFILIVVSVPAAKRSSGLTELNNES